MHRRGLDVLWVLGAILIFVLSTVAATNNHVSQVETDIFQAINAIPGALLPLFWIPMQLGNLVVVPIMAIVGLVTRHPRPALDIAAAGTAAWVLARIIKAGIERDRPGGLIADVIVRGEVPVGLGYVSGHAAIATAIAVAAGPWLPRPWRIAGWCLAGVVGLARVYVGAHLPLDVVGGAALGAGLAGLGHIVFGVPERPGL